MAAGTKWCSRDKVYRAKWRHMLISKDDGTLWLKHLQTVYHLNKCMGLVTTTLLPGFPKIMGCFQSLEPDDMDRIL